MKIVCPNCGTAYQLSSQALGRAGRTVRCARCRSEWLAQRDDGEDDFSENLAETTLVSPEPETAPVDDPADVSHNLEEAIRRIEERTIDAETAIPDYSIGNIENAARDRGGKKRLPLIGQNRHPPAAAAAVAFGILLLGGALLFRAEIVRMVPDLAGFYRMAGLAVNVRGLEFAELKTSQVYKDGVPVLVVEGEIANVTGAAVLIPTIRFALRNDTNREIYTWTHDVRTSILDAGQTAHFRSSITGMPGGGESVQMRFIDSKVRQARL
ncbi:MAG: zinc-ribbon domain-containing protein [Hyphomicrobiales bacterium]|nr:zinc-ribbon domain-containing protein [Hyphomicrobiales bacterium]